MEISVQNKVYYWCKADLKISINCGGCTFSFNDSKDTLLSKERTSLIIWSLMSTPSELLNLRVFILLGDGHIGVLEIKNIHIYSTSNHSFTPTSKDHNSVHFLDSFRMRLGT